MELVILKLLGILMTSQKIGCSSVVFNKVVLVKAPGLFRQRIYLSPVTILSFQILIAFLNLMSQTAVQKAFVQKGIPVMPMGFLLACRL